MILQLVDSLLLDSSLLRKAQAALIYGRNHAKITRYSCSPANRKHPALLAEPNFPDSKAKKEEQNNRSIYHCHRLTASWLMNSSAADPNLQLANVLIMPATPCDWTLLHFRLFKYQQACSQPPHNQWASPNMPLMKERVRIYPCTGGCGIISMPSSQAGNKTCQIHLRMCQNSIVAYGCDALILA